MEQQSGQEKHIAEKSSLGKLLESSTFARIKARSRSLIDKVLGNKNQNIFWSLRPKDDIKIDKAYQEAFDYAFDKRNQICNLAVTGDLGVGKTSLIRSYLTSHDIRWIDVSLADFEERPIRNEKLEEKILLQFQCEQGFSSKHDFLYRGCIFLCLTVGWNYFVGFPVSAHTYISDCLFMINAAIEGSALLTFLTVFVLLFVMYKSIQWVMDLFRKISYKIKIKLLGQFDIDLEKTADAEQFDRNIEAISDMFRSVGKRVVLIEDLDRFDELGIFVKLRELNRLLNLSLKKQVIFIYAIRDSLFNDAMKESKFFDFVIPVVPIVHETNAEGLFRKRIRKLLNEFPMNDQRKENEIRCCSHLICSIMPYIRDVRVLNAICNEFKVRAGVLGTGCSDDSNSGATKDKRPKVILSLYQLLALVIYKNYYPRDFEMSLRNEGLLSDIFSSKQKRASDLKGKLQSEAESIQKKLDEKSIIDSIEAWKAHVLHCIGKEDDGNLYIEYNDKSKMHWTDFLSGQTEIIQTDVSNILSGWRDAVFRVTDDQDIYTSKFHFLDKSSKLRRELEGIANEIDAWRRERSRLRLFNERCEQVERMSMRQLVQLPQGAKLMMEDFFDDNGNISKSYYLAFTLLSKGPEGVHGGFIDESYRNYLSIFHEGGISSTDYNFLMSFQAYKKLPYFYKLDNPGRIMEFIKPEGCRREAAWNKSLIDLLLSPGVIVGANEYLRNIASMLMDNCLYDDQMLWEFFHQASDEEKVKFFSYLRDSSGNLISRLVWNNHQSVPVDHKIAYVKHIISYPEQADYTDVSLNYFIINHDTLLMLGLEDEAFLIKFDQYRQQAHLALPTLEELEKWESDDLEKKDKLKQIIKSMLKSDL